MLTDLDEALERLQTLDFEFGDGRANQGSAVVVALDALGHPSLIPFFVDVYVPRLRPLEPGTELRNGARMRALGDRARRADWLVTYEADIEANGCTATLEAALPILLPGAFAAEGTGALRVAAALFALAGGAGHARRRELAFGLAHWASRYRVLPGEPGAKPAPGRSLAATLDAFETTASSLQRSGPMSGAAAELEGDAGFVAQLAAIDLDAVSPSVSILEAVERLATLQLASPALRGVYGHAIKGAMAMHALIEHVPVASRRAVAGGAAQLVLAIHALHAAGDPAHAARPAADPERDALAGDVDELRYRAACSGDEDAILLAEACLRAHAAHPAAVLLQAAADAALRFDSAHGGRGG